MKVTEPMNSQETRESELQPLKQIRMLNLHHFLQIYRHIQMISYSREIHL